MLFLVQMDVRIPQQTDPETVEKLKAAEKARAQELQRSGQWRHLWRVAGRHAAARRWRIRRRELELEVRIQIPTDVAITNRNSK